MCPHRRDLVAVYQLVKGQPMPVSVICRKLAKLGMNLCSARMCASIFDELGLMRYDAAADTAVRVPVQEKRDLNESQRYRAILKLAQTTA
jgi:hypothetical protein